MTQQQIPQRKGSGGNVLAWVVVIVVLGFVFGMIKVTTTTTYTPASQVCMSQGGTLPGC